MVSESDRRFKFADCRVDEAGKVVEQPVTSGLLAGRTLSMHLIDKEGNDTCPLLSINDLRRLRMIVDYEDSKVMFKDSPEVWRKLPTTKKCLMMMPLTREACDKYRITDTPPPPKSTGNGRVKRKPKPSKFVTAVALVQRNRVCNPGPEKQAKSRIRRNLLRS